MVNGSKLNVLQTSLKGTLTEEEFVGFNHQIIRNFTIEKVLNSLTILDSKAVIADIDLVVKKMSSFSNAELLNQTRMALYVHVSCMIEQIIHNQSLRTEPQGFEEKNLDQAKLLVIREAFKIVERVYNINIPKAEFQYIYQLIFDSENNAGNQSISNVDSF